MHLTFVIDTILL